jgi:aspartyl-tRNA(Asn)/glutamyl-tRNA(Gln) amidotransferase subunit C
MSIDRKTVKKIAGLARIEVSEAEEDHLALELSKMLNFIEQLAEVNTDGVEPLTSVSALGMRTRPDVVNDGSIAVQVLTNAPEATSDYFTVPKVVE